MIITIDGPAAAGKGTLANNLSQRYDYAYFDTGMVYRAVGLEMHLLGKNLEDENAALEVAQNLTFEQMQELAKHPDFRSALGGKNASIVSAYPKVRAALSKGVIYDGRDTGTVVCPQADIKFFITASPEVRAERRYKEFLQKGIAADYNEVLADVKARDARDSNRAAAPMKPAADAIIFDTSKLNIQEVTKKACEVIDEKQKS